jgi:gamma-glutamylcyclotransferase
MRVVCHCSQEGVSQGYYRALEVEVETAAGEKHRCRTYQLLHEGAEDKRPSPQYLDVILRGARQNCLPQEYVDRLQVATGSRFIQLQG